MSYVPNGTDIPNFDGLPNDNITISNQAVLQAARDHRRSAISTPSRQKFMKERGRRQHHAKIEADLKARSIGSEAGCKHAVQGLAAASMCSPVGTGRGVPCNVVRAQHCDAELPELYRGIGERQVIAKASFVGRGNSQA
jgi:hypothetical protein